MLVLLFAMALTDVQQAHHDEIEQAIYKRIEADRAAISDIWPAESQAAGRLQPKLTPVTWSFISTEVQIAIRTLPKSKKT
jgi:hypothetical protein